MGFLDNLGNGFKNLKLSAMKATPEILVVGGIVGVVASTVMACRATLKANEVIEGTKEELQKIETVAEEHPEEYTPEVKKKDTAIVYSKAGLEFVKIYGPSVALGVASVGCILWSHKILRNRNIALAAAYGVLDRGYKAYRKRVKEELGDEIDNHFMYGTENETITEEVVDEETGKTKKVKHKAFAIPSDQEMYGRWFDRTSSKWENNLEYNIMYLKQIEDLFNNRLNAEGFVFLNEVYDALGIERTPEGQCVGWLKNGLGDGYIDFRIWGVCADVADRGDYYVVRKLPSGENVRGADVFLDFNVDGPILNDF